MSNLLNISKCTSGNALKKHEEEGNEKLLIIQHIDDLVACSNVHWNILARREMRSAIHRTKITNSRMTHSLMRLTIVINYL
ncbi:hypothetical protein MCAMS1_00768 [biofilm metagenome]